MIAAIPLLSSAVTSLFGTGTAAATAGTAASAAPASTDSFSSILASFSKDTVDAMKTGESMSIMGIEGKANTQAVVEAVVTAQEKLQTALAIRDKAVASFQDITRMSI